MFFQWPPIDDHNLFVWTEIGSVVHMICSFCAQEEWSDAQKPIFSHEYTQFLKHNAWVNSDNHVCGSKYLNMGLLIKKT